MQNIDHAEWFMLMDGKHSMKVMLIGRMMWKWRCAHGVRRQILILSPEHVTASNLFENARVDERMRDCALEWGKTMMENMYDTQNTCVYNSNNEGPPPPPPTSLPHQFTLECTLEFAGWKIRETNEASIIPRWMKERERERDSWSMIGISSYWILYFNIKCHVATFQWHKHCFPTSSCFLIFIHFYFFCWFIIILLLFHFVFLHFCSIWFVS